MIYVLIFCNITLLLGGQILWKLAVTGISHWDIKTFIHVLLSPLFITGGCLYVLATMLWLVILSKIPLSIAYPFQSISYIFGMIAAYFVFKEHISATQIIGTGVLIIGVYLISK